MSGVDLTWSEHLMLPDWIFTLIMCGGADPCLVLCIKYLKCILIFLANTVKKSALALCWRSSSLFLKA